MESIHKIHLGHFAGLDGATDLSVTLPVTTFDCAQKGIHIRNMIMNARDIFVTKNQDNDLQTRVIYINFGVWKYDKF